MSHNLLRFKGKDFYYLQKVTDHSTTLCPTHYKTTESNFFTAVCPRTELKPRFRNFSYSDASVDNSSRPHLRSNLSQKKELRRFVEI